MPSPMELELKNVELHAGDRVQVKGKIMHDAERFQIDLGSDTNNLALHFNPRFPNDTGEATLVCNSKDGGCWGAEQREKHLNLQRGSLVKIVLKLMGDMFEVELPDGKEFQFPNRHGLDVITYVRVRGDFKCTCFKIC
ncbi:galectin-2-like [Esox lucius]|uniref:galectin-2-like n=1 Tax=Esox lucius TaxID=8010 RepID=UPI00097334B7|nr:galectin-2-like [Esox lucius]